MEALFYFSSYSAAMELNSLKDMQSVSSGNITPLETPLAELTSEELAPVVPSVYASKGENSEDDAEAVIRERQLTIYYKAPDVTAKEIDIIAEHWNNGTPIINLMRRLQPQRCNANKPPLIYVDLYSILYTLAAARRIVQRGTNQDELTINDFADFFRIWKKGGSFRECCRGIKERPTNACLKFAALVHRSIGDRYRKEKKQISENPHARLSNPLDHIMELGIRRKVDDRDALVVFMSDIPIELIGQLRRLPNGLKYDPSVRSGVDVFDRVRAMPPPPPVPHAAPRKREKWGDDDSDSVDDVVDHDIQTLDPLGTLTAAGKQQLLDKQQEQAQRKRLAFGRPSSKSVETNDIPSTPQADRPSSYEEVDELEILLSDTPGSGNLTLENLADDDPVD